MLAPMNFFYDVVGVLVRNNSFAERKLSSVNVIRTLIMAAFTLPLILPEIIEP